MNPLSWEGMGFRLPCRCQDWSPARSGPIMGSVKLGRWARDKPLVLVFYFPDCYLSNCYLKEYITSDGKKFNCAQQHFQYEKAMFFNDPESAKKILQSSSPKYQKMLGHKVKNYNDKVWGNIKDSVMKRVVLEKFSSDPELKERFLRDVKPDYIIAEGGPPKEDYWGTGVPLDFYYAYNTEKWSGKNMLGKILKEVYFELQNNNNVRRDDSDSSND